MSLLDNLNDSDIFTDSEMIVIKFIIDNLDLVVNMTINELAQSTYSSRTTIIRICKKLGFKGYRDFKIELTRSIESSKYIIYNSIDYSFPFKLYESDLQILNSIANVYKNAIDLINSELNLMELKKIADTLIKSNHVYLFACGDSQITAMNFINKCIKIGKCFHLSTQYGEQNYYAKYANSNDCCFFISYDKNDYYNSCVRHILKNRCKIIVLTANENSFLTRCSTYKIVIPHQEESIDKIATFYSQQGFQYVLSVIYSLMYKCIIKL